MSQFYSTSDRRVKCKVSQSASTRQRVFREPISVDYQCATKSRSAWKQSLIVRYDFRVEFNLKIDEPPRAGWTELAGRIWPAGRTLPTPGLNSAIIPTQCRMIYWRYFLWLSGASRWPVPNFSISSCHWLCSLTTVVVSDITRCLGGLTWSCSWLVPRPCTYRCFYFCLYPYPCFYLLVLFQGSPVWGTGRAGTEAGRVCGVVLVGWWGYTCWCCCQWCWSRLNHGGICCAGWGGWVCRLYMSFHSR